MSRSSLWVMDKEFKGYEIEEYGNSWLFSPMIWDVLLEKYMNEDIQTPFGFKKSLIGLDGIELSKKLNNIINNCPDFADRVAWEMTNHQVFFTKDQEAIAQAIKDFAQQNTAYCINEELGKSSLATDHIAERFTDIAEGISRIDAEKYPYFIFKNTSVDDNVENWFEGYDEETEEGHERTLAEIDKSVTEFVVIEEKEIKGFLSNLSFFKKQLKPQVHE